MARRKNRAEILADIEDLKKQLAESEEREERRIGKLANKAGLLDLDISDEELAKASTRPRRGCDRVLFLVDEARMLGTMSLLETVRDALRKYGITLVLVYQSVGQLDEIWGRHARSKWFDNVDWMSFAAVGHLETAEFIAKKCGTYTVETVSRTRSSAGRSSRTRSYASRDLIMPQEVMQDMRADEQIVFVRGQRPIRCGRAIFFRRRR